MSFSCQKPPKVPHQGLGKSTHRPLTCVNWVTKEWLFIDSLIWFSLRSKGWFIWICSISSKNVMFLNSSKVNITWLPFLHCFFLKSKEFGNTFGWSHELGSFPSLGSFEKPKRLWAKRPENLRKGFLVFSFFCSLSNSCSLQQNKVWGLDFPVPLLWNSSPFSSSPATNSKQGPQTNSNNTPWEFVGNAGSLGPL